MAKFIIIINHINDNDKISDGSIFCQHKKIIFQGDEKKIVILKSVRRALGGVE